VKTRLAPLSYALVGVTAIALSGLPAVAQNPVTGQPDLTPLSVYNVKRYGARGDGMADDTAAIRATIGAGGGGFEGTSAARIVFFPVGTYKITASIDVPPNVVLRGASRFSTNLTGSTINVAFDGAGIRLVRRNSYPGSLFHLGGVEDLAFSGLGSAATSASRFIELGDSRAVNVSTGAWNVFIRRCVFSYSHGYGIYAAHSQEAQIDSNWFRNRQVPHLLSDGHRRRADQRQHAAR
jgi:polygalacturonase